MEWRFSLSAPQMRFHARLLHEIHLGRGDGVSDQHPCARGPLTGKYLPRREGNCTRTYCTRTVPARCSCGTQGYELDGSVLRTEVPKCDANTELRVLVLRSCSGLSTVGVARMRECTKATRSRVQVDSGWKRIERSGEIKIHRSELR